MDNLLLSPVFRALSDPTRRHVVEHLGRGPASVTELAAPFDMALPSFLKHLRVLEESGLIRSEKVGRVRTCTLERARLDNAALWLEKHRSNDESPRDEVHRADVYRHTPKETED